METREELLRKLYAARRIIQSAEALTGRYNATKSKLLNQYSYIREEDKRSSRAGRSIGKIAFWLVAVPILFCTTICLIYYVLMLFHLHSKYEVAAAFVYIGIYLGLALAVILTIVLIRKSRKKRYAQANAENEKIMRIENQRRAAYNAQVMAEAQQINEEMQKIRQIANEQLTWYPRNYCYSEAVDFFIDAIQNFRADSLKEAINLYIEEQRHRQLLLNQQKIANQQQQIARQQQISNVLSTANLFANLGTINAMNNNTSAVNAAAASTNRKIDEAARYIRTGERPNMW